MNSNYLPFIQARPVWPLGRETEMNVTCRFTAQVPAGKQVLLRMTGSSAYRVFINGKMIAYGPARGPKYFFRVDEMELAPYLSGNNNLVLFEIVGYNVNNFYLPDQPSFFQAEITCDNTLIAWTAPASDKDIPGVMPCDVVTERVQKIQKYSYQRALAEAWRLGKSYSDAYTKMTDGKAILADCGDKVYLQRRVPFATLADIRPDSMIASGSITLRDTAENPWRGRELTGIDQVSQKGFTMDELEVQLSEDAARYEFHTDNNEVTDAPETLSIGADRFATFKFAHDYSGFIAAKVHCSKPVTVIFTFDELFQNGDVNMFHIGCVNLVRFDLKPGDYSLISMEPYTLQYLKIMVFGGEVSVSDIRVIEYAAPADDFVTYTSDNENLVKIWNAAVETYRQNAVDLYTDCPCRERAGWLCDSFWTSRTEKYLTGKSVVEKNFLENFLLPEHFEHLPEGMFPMCYPGDQYNGEHIPQWAMWLVMELREYKTRTGDVRMVDAFRDKIYSLIDYLDQFVNEDGLLEKLPGWNFIEWSRANELVQDVNFPGNMLYAAMLEAAAELYDDPAFKERADRMRETIRRLSFDGHFFTDHMVRGEDGKLHNDGEATEVCQYYAFYLGTASPETYPELWNTLITDFGPHRKEEGKNKYPQISFANAFIGNYLRLDMMAKNGYMKDVLENIEGYFLKMAELTGTLWEYDSTVASLNHGFASHVLVWLLDAKKMGI